MEISSFLALSNLRILDKKRKKKISSTRRHFIFTDLLWHSWEAVFHFIPRQLFALERTYYHLSMLPFFQPSFSNNLTHHWGRQSELKKCEFIFWNMEKSRLSVKLTSFRQGLEISRKRKFKFIRKSLTALANFLIFFKEAKSACSIIKKENFKNKIIHF